MNPALSNLGYGTPKKNSQDAAARGLLARGEVRASAKLTDERVMAARALFPDHVSMGRLSRAFEVSGNTIRRVVNRNAREGWAHVKRGLPLAEAVRVLLMAEQAVLMRYALPFMVAALEARRASART